MALEVKGIPAIFLPERQMHQKLSPFHAGRYITPKPDSNNCVCSSTWPKMVTRPRSWTFAACTARQISTHTDAHMHVLRGGLIFWRVCARLRRGPFSSVLLVFWRRIISVLREENFCAADIFSFSFSTSGLPSILLLKSYLFWSEVVYGMFLLLFLFFFLSPKHTKILGYYIFDIIRNSMTITF